jgi:hypothetical protein
LDSTYRRQGSRANLGLARQGGSHARHRGAVLRDLVVMLADGGRLVAQTLVAWAQALLAAFARLRALPWPARC